MQLSLGIAVFSLGRKVETNLALKEFAGLPVGLFGGHRYLFLAEGLIGQTGSDGNFKGHLLLRLCVSVVDFPPEFEHNLAVYGNLDRGLPGLLASGCLSRLENWLSGRVTLGGDFLGQMAIGDLEGAVAVKFDPEMVVFGSAGRLCDRFSLVRDLEVLSARRLCLEEELVGVAVVLDFGDGEGGTGCTGLEC